MNKKLIGLVLFIIIFAVSANFESKSADTTIVQTFTFDSVFTRRATFKFPDSKEKFQRVIAKYRLKCDPKTQHDKYSCGEWDYLTYLRIMKPTDEYDFLVRKHPVYTFGNFSKLQTDTKLEFLNTPVLDKVEKSNIKLIATSNNSRQIELYKDGLDSLTGFSRHQFLVTYKELAAAGLVAGSKIGKVTFDINIQDTIRDFFVKVAAVSKLTQNITGYYDANAFKLMATQSYIAPEECADGKLTIDFSEDFEYNGNTNLIFEIIYNSDFDYLNGAPVFIGTNTNSNRGASAVALHYAKLDGKNSWINVSTLPEISGKQHFSWEAWIKLDSIGNIFSLGDKVIFSAVEAEKNNTAAKLRLSLNNYRNSISTTNSAELKLNTWTHVAVVFDGTGEQCKDVVKIYINGKETSMNYTNWYNNGWDVYMPRFIDDLPVSFSIGRGAYNKETDIKSNIAGSFAQVRIWTASLADTTIEKWYKEKNITPEHPNSSNLHTYLKFDDEYGTLDLFNSGFSNISAKVIGQVELLCGDDAPVLVKNNGFIPSITLSIGDFEYSKQVLTERIDRKQLPTTIVYFSAENHYPEISKIDYKYSTYSYVYDENNNKLDSSKLSAEVLEFTVSDELFEYETKHYPKKQIFELGRFITPYGINLSLGANGFEWEYDLTDYMNELRGDVEIEAHNNQELLDLKFLFIKGEPNRKILRVSEPWGGAASYLYKDLARDTELSDVEVTLLPETKSVKLKARLTGHGMVPNTSHPSQCCEFLSNTHRIYAGSNEYDYELAGEWKIWELCTNNPVYPQGGTWMLPREGWCPGATVKDYEFDLTDYITNGKIMLNYEIDDAKLNIYPEIGDGNYVTNFHLVEYAAAIDKNDLELFEVVTPSDADIHRKLNPICNGIKLIVRNNSDEDIVNYSIKLVNKSNIEEIHEINKTIKARSFDTTTIMLRDANFWNSMASDTQSIDISVLPINAIDDNLDNNHATSNFILPDFYAKEDFTIKYKTNLRASDYTLKIYDFSDKLIKTLPANDNNRIYNFTLKDLPNGCYRMELVDTRYYYGLSSWMVSAQGNGSIEITDIDGKTLKTFNPDFGKQLVYSFVLDGFTKIKEKDIINSLMIYPNPSSEFIILDATENFGKMTVRIYNSSGATVLDKEIFLESGKLKLDISFLPKGAYSVGVTSGESTKWSNFIRN